MVIVCGVTADHTRIPVVCVSAWNCTGAVGGESGVSPVRLFSPMRLCRICVPPMNAPGAWLLKRHAGEAVALDQIALDDVVIGGRAGEGRGQEDSGAEPVRPLLVTTLRRMVLL